MANSGPIVQGQWRLQLAAKEATDDGHVVGALGVTEARVDGVPPPPLRAAGRLAPRRGRDPFALAETLPAASTAGSRHTAGSDLDCGDAATVAGRGAAAAGGTIVRDYVKNFSLVYFEQDWFFLSSSSPSSTELPLCAAPVAAAAPPQADSISGGQARGACLMPHAATLHGAFKVEPRGVFRIRLVQQPPTGTTAEGEAVALAAAPPLTAASPSAAQLVSPQSAADELRVLKARAQLRQSERRRILGGAYDGGSDDSDGGGAGGGNTTIATKAAGTNRGAAPPLSPTAARWHALPAADLPRALHEARVEALRRSAEHLLTHEAVKTAAADAYYGARMAEVLASMAGEAQARQHGALTAARRASLATASAIEPPAPALTLALQQVRLPATAAAAAVAAARDATTAAPCALCRAEQPGGQPSRDLCAARKQAMLAMVAGNEAGGHEAALSPAAAASCDAALYGLGRLVRSASSFAAVLRAQDTDTRSLVAAHLL